MKSAIYDLFDGILTSESHECEQEKEGQKDQKDNPPPSRVSARGTGLDVVKDTHSDEQEWLIETTLAINERRDSQSGDCKKVLVPAAKEIRADR